MAEHITYENVVSKLLATVPEFRSYPDNWLKQFEHDVHHGQHAVFGAFTHFFIEEFRSKRAGEESAFQRALDFLEKAMGSEDVEVQNLVWCSFLENLHLAKKDYAHIKARLGKNLRENLEKIEVQYGESGSNP